MTQPPRPPSTPDGAPPKAPRNGFRSVRPSRGVLSAGPEIPPDMRRISATARVPETVGAPAAEGVAEGTTDASAVGTPPKDAPEGGTPRPDAPAAGTPSDAAPAGTDGPKPARKPPVRQPPDDSPTMLLPVIGAIKPPSPGKIVAGVIGVIAVIVVGVLLLTVVIPAEGRRRAAASDPATATASASVPSPPPPAHSPAGALCPLVNAGALRATFPVSAPGRSQLVNSGDSAVATCTLNAQGAPSTATPPVKLALVAQVAAHYFAVDAQGEVYYDKQVPATGATPLTGIGRQAAGYVVTKGAGPVVTLRAYALADNLVLGVTGTATRSDRPWTAAETSQLSAALAQVLRTTMAKL